MPDNIYTLGGINYDQSTRQGRVGFRQAARDQRKRNRMSIADGNLSDEEIIDLQDENKLLRGQSMQAGYDALQSATNGLGAGLISSGANFVNDMLESTLGSPAEYEGDKGHITQGLNEAYDAASDAAMKMGPIGMIVGGAMKGVKALDAITGGATGTSGMTTADAILGSNWLKLTPIGLVNSLVGSTTDTITRDEEAFGTVGSSYGGTGATVDDAVSKSGKKYGLFSTGKRKEADALIDEADRQQDIMSDIADEVMALHYMGLVGLYPLCSTCHEYAHGEANDLFIPLDNIWGDPVAFYDIYKEYFPEQLANKFENVLELNKGYQIMQGIVPEGLIRNLIYINNVGDEDSDFQVPSNAKLIDFLNSI